jgi:reversibly glycosylated polypeptide/UDP-arabinopyranose mutase
MSIAVVVPSIRPNSWREFVEEWEKLFYVHSAHFITVWDGDKPELFHDDKEYSVKDVMGKDEDLIYNKNDGVRNLGFAYIARFLPDVEYIITLDDDTKPSGDTIADHIKTLNFKVPISWISTITDYPRGFPYGVREEAEVVLSHGVWEGIKDWDAPTQLIHGNKDAFFYVGPIPKGIFYPMCGMNIAFKRKMLPYMYYAPMGPRVGLDRFADIWLGIESKKIIDKKGWAVMSGFASVVHNKASNVWKNLQKEARGLELNETYWKGDESDPYFKLYRKQRKKWKEFICKVQK